VIGQAEERLKKGHEGQAVKGNWLSQRAVAITTGPSGSRSCFFWGGFFFFTVGGLFLWFGRPVSVLEQQSDVLVKPHGEKAAATKKHPGGAWGGERR